MKHKSGQISEILLTLAVRLAAGDSWSILSIVTGFMQILRGVSPEGVEQQAS